MNVSPTPQIFFTLTQLTRLTHDRYRDVADATRTHVIDFLKQHHAPEHYHALVHTGGQLREEEQNLAIGETLPRGSKGEFCTRGYSVMLGYWNDAERTAEAIDADGWMHTGDLAEMREDGYCNIVGRIKDMVIRGGENIYPREIEEFLYTHPDVVDAQVIGVPDAKYGEELMAWIRLRLPQLQRLVEFLCLLPLAQLIYILSVEDHSRLPLIIEAVFLSLAALSVGAITFRVLQPYAFVGPTISHWAINQNWLDETLHVAELSRLPTDGWPPSVQWFQRIPFLYAWFNMAVWGMGLALGLTATLAIAAAVVKQALARRLSIAVGLLTGWVIVYFFLTGGLHQMTMRYYLPMYAVFAVLAAWALVELVRRANRAPARRRAALRRSPAARR